MFTQGEQPRSFLLIIEKRDYKQHILFCSLFKQCSYTKAKLLKGVLHIYYLLCMLKPSLTFILLFGPKSPCKTSVCRIRGYRQYVYRSALFQIKGDERGEKSGSPDFFLFLSQFCISCSPSPTISDFHFFL